MTSPVDPSIEITGNACDGDTVQARTKWQADDIDGVTYVTGTSGITPGTFIDARLDEVIEDVDFGASFVRAISAPPAPVRATRTLRVLGSVGSFGR